MICKICNNTEGNVAYDMREMMLGYKDSFTYFQCSKCKCLQILKVPADMSKYYPPNYYSLNPFSPDSLRSKRIIKRFFRKRRDSYAVFGKDLLGKLVYRFFPDAILRILLQLNLTKDTSILDIGSGQGCTLYSLKNIGFNNLLGIDPYIKGDIEYENGLKILKRTIYEVSGKWDIIMLHHSFEHMKEPLKDIEIISELLVKNGFCLIRIPTVSSWAWKYYGVNWVQIDAPRHFFLHSIESMNVLTKKAGLSLENVIYDSTEFQFWGSEQYIRDIPLNDIHSYKINPEKSIFSKRDIAGFRRKATELNLGKRGDSASLFFKKNL
jgi:SAM-dependent methyltransferase